MARQRNNIYAVAADAVDLALDTAGTIGSMVGGVAHMIGIGGSEPEKSEEHERREVHDAADRVATSVREEAEAAKPSPHRARGGNTNTSKRRSPKSARKTVKSRARKVA